MVCSSICLGLLYMSPIYYTTRALHDFKKTMMPVCTLMCVSLRRVMPDLIAWNAAMTACAKARQWEQAGWEHERQW